MTMSVPVICRLNSSFTHETERIKTDIFVSSRSLPEMKTHDEYFINLRIKGMSLGLWGILPGIQLVAYKMFS